MAKSHHPEAITELISPMLTAAGYSLVDVAWGSAYKRRTLTLYVDKPTGISLSECQSLARSLGDYLDEEDVIEGSYCLEVSSPGAERPLKKIEDYEIFSGRYAFVLLREPVTPGGVFEMYGYLQGTEGSTVLFLTLDDELLRIPLAHILKARLAIKF